MSKRQTLGPVIHAGIERAASTFLQSQIFPEIACRPYQPALAGALGQLGNAHHEDLDPAVTRAISEVRDQNVLLSTEGFLCRRLAYTGKPGPDPALSIVNARALMGEKLRLLLVIRRQDSAIESMVRYKQRYLSDPAMYLVDWPVRRSRVGVSWRFESLTGRLVESYNYYRHLVMAAAILGRDRLHVLVYEDLAADPGAFFGALGEALGEDLSRFAGREFERVNQTSWKYAQLTGRYVPMGHFFRRINNLSGYRLERLLPGRQAVFSEQDRARLLDVFREDNRRLARFLDLDLARYGYC